MSDQLPHPLLTPWQASEQTQNTQSAIITSNRATIWQVRKPSLPGDLHSTSTVTTSESPSSSSASSPHSSNSPSPISTTNPSPTKWHFDEYDDRVETPPTTPPPHQPGSIRTLPRCGVVNFRKDGDSLRWAPRVTQNSSGVAARVHNFEDAFSLEEFSSRALPVVWRSRGGNPRLSELAMSDDADQLRPVRATKSVPNGSHSPLPPPPLPTRSPPPMEKRAKSTGQSQRSLVRNSSIQKAMVIASEVSRPSFWSLLVHTNKYQRSKAKARLQHDSTKRSESTAKRPVQRSRPEHSTDETSTAVASEKEKDGVARKPWVSLPGRKHQRASRGGRARKRAPEATDKKKKPLLQRLLSHVERRNGKKRDPKPKNIVPQSRPAVTTRVAFSQSASNSDSDEKPTNPEKQRGVFRQPRLSDGNINRRVVSALAANLPPLKPTPRRQLTRVASQDDQYVTFITSES